MNKNQDNIEQSDNISFFIKDLQRELILLREAHHTNNEILNQTLNELRFTQKELARVEIAYHTMSESYEKAIKLVDSQNNKIEQLEEEVKQLKHKKTSNNSSVAPSKDENRAKKTNSLREKSTKTNGGQLGHEGHTLEFVDKPIQIEHYCPVYCSSCGEELTSAPILKETRQVIDVPPIVPTITEHRVYTRRCTCGVCNVEEFPKSVKGPVSYGTSVEALCSYFSSKQYISIKRIQEVFADLFGIKISQGTVANKLNSFNNKCTDIYETLRTKMENSKYVGVDETGCKVNGDKMWAWTWQTPSLTYLTVSNNRGLATVENNFPNGFPSAVLAHDCWRAHFKTPCLRHQICIEHIRRELMYFIEKSQAPWAKHFTVFLMDALKLKKEILANPNKSFNQQIDLINKDLEKHLSKLDQIEEKGLLSLAKRLKKQQNYILTFLDHRDVPPDNNGSERAIRNFKVKLKVSGFFKTIRGAIGYAKARSIIDTTAKNNRNVFEALSLIVAN